MIRNDAWIRENGPKIITWGFVDHLETHDFDLKRLSYGISSYGYDIRLGQKEFCIHEHIPGTVGDVKRFNPENVRWQRFQTTSRGEKFFVLPAHSYGLGVSYEYIEVPNDVAILCLGKSTYARAGIILNTTPLEPGWKGHITLEFSNASHADQRLYVHEGIAQLWFFQGDPCEITYAMRKGKYQDQQNQVTLPKL